MTSAPTESFPLSGVILGVSALVLMLAYAALGA
jgi:hypothetical protein